MSLFLLFLLRVLRASAVSCFWLRLSRSVYMYLQKGNSPAKTWILHQRLNPGASQRRRVAELTRQAIQ